MMPAGTFETSAYVLNRTEKGRTQSVGAGHAVRFCLSVPRPCTSASFNRSHGVSRTICHPELGSFRRSACNL